MSEEDAELKNGSSGIYKERVREANDNILHQKSTPTSNHTFVIPKRY